MTLAGLDPNTEKVLSALIQCLPYKAEMQADLRAQGLPHSDADFEASIRNLLEGGFVKFIMSGDQYALVPSFPDAGEAEHSPAAQSGEGRA